MTNHTPAPWVIDNDGDITHFGDYDQEDCECVALGRGGDGIRIKNPADRDLILAAPDMYEALERVLEFLNEKETIAGAGIYWTVFDALKKARGEA